MKIITLDPGHAEAYLELRLEGLKNNPEAFGSSYEEEKHYSADLYRSRLESDSTFIFGAFEGDQLIGVVTLLKEQKLKMKHKAGIFAMYVSPEKRGRGIGKRLMEEAIKKARELEGTEQLYLGVVTSNESAKNLYSSLGFQAFGIDKRALKIDNLYFDEEHMVLFL
ncbi:GNAT family N-acetyltransferase [Neobacillus sp. PS3-34]|uniref:GNAT family N-acetyltransferase n=1 Tax=Neobacillus sp. PS3-34 TaxID=3070678 RepID=UPI0027E098BF|nr:GNAT family N-acetyltransferase [Neobacillus sp. PS3-34]WML49964.1 GNAT family N-acetyltransferase [Neobacillus sp. PS3-34]